MDTSLIFAVLAGFLILIIAISLIYHLKVHLVRIVAVIFMAFLITAFIVILKSGISIGEDGWITGFANAYFDYAKQLTSNVGEITGQVIKQDWMPN